MTKDDRDASNDEIAVHFRDDPNSHHELVKQAEQSLEDPSTSSCGLLWTPAGKSFHIAISPKSKARALRIIDALWIALESIGATVLPVESKSKHLGLTLDGEQMSFSLNETCKRIERKLTPAERRELDRTKFSLFVKRHEWQPTGKLIFRILFRDGREWLKFQDGRQSLESQLPEIVQLMRRFPDEQRAQRLASAERERFEAERAAFRERRLVKADAELSKLRKSEQLAAQYERAQRLRTYIDALESACIAAGEPTGTGSEWGEELEWLRHAANWLDPLQRTDWPEVDNAPAPPWWVDYQRSKDALPR